MTNTSIYGFFIIGCYLKIKSGWLIHPPNVRVTKNIDYVTF